MSLKTRIEKLNFFVFGNLNLNCLECNENLEIRTFYNRILADGCISLITRQTRVTSKVSLIDNIFTFFCWHVCWKWCVGPFLAYYKSTNHWQTTNHRPTDRSSTDPWTAGNWPLTHQQVLQQPTNNQPLTHQQVVNQPTDHWKPIHRPY